jgi:histone acetyltransferase (RNA polymerase elongator complex component)
MTPSKQAIILEVKDNVADYIEPFYQKVWHKANVDYFGKQVDWSTKKKVLEAYDGEELVGVLELHMQVGVAYVFELAVAYSHQKHGIGTLLMHKAEEVARQEKMHKIHFETGKTWGTAEFYEKLGYIKTGEYPRHYGGHDYVQFSKFLD